MSRSQSASEASRLPVIHVHASGRQPDPVALSGLHEIASAVCGRVDAEGLVRTEHGFDEPVPLLRELAQRFPGSAVALVRAGLTPNAFQLAELTAILERSGGPMALTLLSNAHPSVNPFAGLKAHETFGPDEAEPLVGLLAPGCLHPLKHWTSHFALLSAEAVAGMAAADDGATLMQALEAADGSLAVPDHLFMHDPSSPLFAAWKLQTHESLYPPQFGDLSARLQQWFDAGLSAPPFAADPGRPATLHVTHSWGGGVAQWIRTFIDADRDGLHYQLRAEGPQSQLGHGQKLSLYAGNELGCPVASWWLRPPVRSVEDSLPFYSHLLERVCRRYRIGRIIVSSLIGHSLDALRTGIPTLQVLHDHFPLWPLLSVNPAPWLRDGQPVDLASALAARHDHLEFHDKDAPAWARLGGQYLEALSGQGVGIAAPGRSVLDLQARLNPAFDPSSAHVIPHGITPPGKVRPVAPRDRADGRLRMVVLGRIQEGKGQKLLLKSLESLTRHVQVYLLGTGKSGEKFFGMSGVNVVIEYEREDLPDLLASIGPHFAALLSIVPETFSYTLSELLLLKIPAIATRVGSFPDRIRHGETGWLIDPESRALVEQVEALCDSPEEIERVRTALEGVSVSTIEEMVSAYEGVLPLSGDPGHFLPAEPGEDRIQFAAADYWLVLERQKVVDGEARQVELREELEDRTGWALDVKRQLAREHEVRTDVEHALAGVREDLAVLNVEYHRQREENTRLSELLERILGSLSWRITRPLRVASRLKQNFMAARAWNPLRWPSLLGGFFGNVSRFGFRRTLVDLQETGGESLEAEVIEAEVVESEEGIVEVVPPEAFPIVEQPDVSIVIPAYNNWPYTAACLRTLADAAGRYSFEVIVVDDASSDETAEALRAIEGLVFLRNEANLGYVGTCNRGAEKARGQFLVMLNNDTEVQPGWLEALIDTLEEQPDAGIVGARLVYPDGRLQESGGIIFSDGSGWNYGREDAADRPEYNVLREVDYCSAACIAMRTELFRNLGGFDERYAPGFYEDTDLAFRVREAGLKVLVQPAATVIHHEGATSGTDISSGMKRYQQVNQEKFVERWRDALASQPAPIQDKTDREALRAASLHRAAEPGN